MGTDPNRAHLLNPKSRQLLVDSLKLACPQSDSECRISDDTQIVKMVEPEKVGYTGAPLDGIWARAPYLHNGSGPTLRHLLVPEMRQPGDKFWRGNIHFDEKNVGFVWDKKVWPHAKEYNTNLEGNSNAGHTGRYLRKDGKKWEGEELESLLEYLKTL